MSIHSEESIACIFDIVDVVLLFTYLHAHDRHFSLLFFLCLLSAARTASRSAGGGTVRHRVNDDCMFVPYNSSRQCLRQRAAQVTEFRRRLTPWDGARSVFPDGIHVTRPTRRPAAGRPVAANLTGSDAMYVYGRSTIPIIQDVLFAHVHRATVSLTISAPTPSPLLPAPGSRLPATDSRLHTPGSRLPAPGSRLATPDSRLRLPTPGSRLPAPDSRLRPAVFVRSQPAAPPCPPGPAAVPAGSRGVARCYLSAQSHVKAAAECLCGSNACPSAAQKLRGTAG